MGGIARLAWILVAGCSAGGYDVVVRFEPPTLADGVERIELALVGDCASQDPRWGEPRGARRILALRRGERTGTLGSVAPGRAGLYARGFGATCGVVAAGCDPVRVVAGGEGTLVVTLWAEAGPACDGECVAAECRGPDAGPTDAGIRDADDVTDADPRTDAGDGTDACTGCTVAGRCEPGTSVDACGGAGGACARCDDGDECTADVCTAGACDTTPRDGTACAGGTCRAGACCTGCWTGTRCEAGTDDAACGASGAACEVCGGAGSCPPASCVAGACESVGASAVTGRTRHSCAVDRAGGGWCWGGPNTAGQHGTGDTIAHTAPARIVSAGTWAMLVAGELHTCGIDGDAALWCWGDATGSRLGVACAGASCTSRTSPTLVDGARTWSVVATTERGGLAVTATGELYAWGTNLAGELALGAPLTTTATPTRVPPAAGSAPRWRTVASRELHSCGIQTDGSLWCWGSNASGELGLGMAGSGTLSPARVGTSTSWAHVAVGGSQTDALRLGSGFTCGIQTDSSLWCWGSTQDGRLGVAGGDETAPSPLPVGSGWRTVHLGAGHACGIKTDGTLWCWGDGADGRLGDGTGADHSTPTRVGSDSDWVDVAAASVHSCGARADGSLWCWGRNDEGRLGTGTMVASSSPVRACL